VDELPEVIQIIDNGNHYPHLLRIRGQRFPLVEGSLRSSARSSAKDSSIARENNGGHEKVNKASLKGYNRS